MSAYFDRDTSAGVREWNCMAHSYNGHRGTDIAIFGGFTAQDQGRTIVAGAAGTVMTTHDVESDRCTTGSCGGGNRAATRTLASQWRTRPCVCESSLSPRCRPS